MPARKKRNEFPQIGSKLIHRSRGKGPTAEAIVVEVREDIGQFAVEMNGKRYESLSAAARALVGHQVNGWKFWGLG